MAGVTASVTRQHVLTGSPRLSVDPASKADEKSAAPAGRPHEALRIAETLPDPTTRAHRTEAAEPVSPRPRSRRTPRFIWSIGMIPS
jgi:hypothetical protein